MQDADHVVGTAAVDRNAREMVAGDLADEAVGWRIDIERKDFLPRRNQHDDAAGSEVEDLVNQLALLRFNFALNLAHAQQRLEFLFRDRFETRGVTCRGETSCEKMEH